MIDVCFHGGGGGGGEREREVGRKGGRERERDVLLDVLGTSSASLKLSLPRAIFRI